MEEEGICTEAATKSAKSWPKRAKLSKRLAPSPALPETIRCLGAAEYGTAYNCNTFTSESFVSSFSSLNCCRMLPLQEVLHVVCDTLNLRLLSPPRNAPRTLP